MGSSLCTFGGAKGRDRVPELVDLIELDLPVTATWVQVACGVRTSIRTVITHY